MPADTIILLRGGTAAEWEAANPVLSFREMGIETDTRKIKVGDGSTAWNSLDYYTTNGVDGDDGTDGLNADITRTSPTSNAIGTGSKTFAFGTSSNLGWVVGTRLRAAASSTQYVEGPATAVSSTSVTINADNTSGSGTFTAWAIGVAGDRGAAGSNGGTGATGSAGANADMTRTSTTSNAIGTGSKTFAFTSSSNLGWVVGTRLRAANSSSNYIEGPVTAVSSTSVTINADNTSGSGTFTSWAISVAGDRGATGSGGGDTSLIGAADLARCTIANNATDATNDIDISAGTEWVFNGTLWKPVAIPALTKRLDAAYGVGTNQGGLDTGSKANNTWYYLWAIHRSDTGVSDVLFSASATSPTMPSSYDYKKYLGAVLTNSSGAIRPFVKIGNYCSMGAIYDLGIYNSATPTSPTTLTISVPRKNGIVANIQLAIGTNATSYRAAFTRTTTGLDCGYLATDIVANQNYKIAAYPVPITNSNAQIIYVTNNASNWFVFEIATLGYWEF